MDNVAIQLATLAAYLAIAHLVPDIGISAGTAGVLARPKSSSYNGFNCRLDLADALTAIPDEHKNWCRKANRRCKT